MSKKVLSKTAAFAASAVSAIGNDNFRNLPIISLLIKALSFTNKVLSKTIT
jgi:hypothetical protein